MDYDPLNKATAHWNLYRGRHLRKLDEEFRTAEMNQLSEDFLDSLSPGELLLLFDHYQEQATAYRASALLIDTHLAECLDEKEESAAQPPEAQQNQ
jgi:hypothetical protein